MASRYGIIMEKDPREIILLKSLPCFWGKCRFCDYIGDNSLDTDLIEDINKSVISRVCGKTGTLEVINSGSCFELPKSTIALIKERALQTKVKKIWFESHWNYRKRFKEFKTFFGNQFEILFKVGVESFDKTFREKILNKGAENLTIEEAVKYCNAVCLLIGVKGQTKEIIKNDIRIIENFFEKSCINIFIENKGPLKRDEKLISWFKKEYRYLEKNTKVDILFDNQDFGVWGAQT